MTHHNLMWWLIDESSDMFRHVCTKTMEKPRKTIVFPWFFTNDVIMNHIHFTTQQLASAGQPVQVDRQLPVNLYAGQPVPSYLLIQGNCRQQILSRCANDNEQFQSSSLSKIWLENRLLCLSWSVAAQEYTWRAIKLLLKKWRYPQNRKHIPNLNCLASPVPKVVSAS